MNRLLFCVFLCLRMSNLFAQQEPMTTQFQHTLVHVNPAVAGNHYRHFGNVLYRYQSDNSSGTPTALFVNHSNYVRNLSGGIGVNYSMNKSGLKTEHKALVHYAYHLVVSRKLKLALGVSAGIGVLDFKSASVGNQQIISDSAVPLASTDETFQFNSGVVFFLKKWRFGFSASQINRPVYHLLNDIHNKGKIHGHMFGEYEYKLNKEVSLLPAFKLSTDFDYYSHIWLLRMKIKNLYTGINLCQDGDTRYYGGMFGYIFDNQYRLTYNYDYSTSRLNTASHSTHELSFSILLRAQRRIVCGIPNVSF